MRRFKSVVQDNIIKFKNLNIDLNTEKVYKDGLNIPLGPTEFKILQLFFQVPNEVFLRQERNNKIFMGKWRDLFNERLIDVHINRIREVLGKDNLIITTVSLSVIV